METLKNKAFPARGGRWMTVGGVRVRDEVVRLRRAGARNREIAKILGITEKQVQGHVGNARARGVDMPLTVGRPKLLSAEQAAVIFEAQVQIHAAQRLINRLLAEAGISPNSWDRVLNNNWRARGRVDVMVKRLKPSAEVQPSAARPGVHRKRTDQVAA